MAIRVVEFSNGGYKIRKVFAYESTYSKEFVEFWELDYWGPRKFSKTRVLKVNYFHLLRKNYLKLKLWLYFSAILLKTLKVYVNFQKKNLNKWALSYVVWYTNHFSHQKPFKYCTPVWKLHNLYCHSRGTGGGGGGGGTPPPVPRSLKIS